MESAPAIPGAVDLINSIESMQVDVIYITIWDCMKRTDGGPEYPQKEDMIDNLLKVGIEVVEAEHVSWEVNNLAARPGKNPEEKLPSLTTESLCYSVMIWEISFRIWRMISYRKSEPNWLTSTASTGDENSSFSAVQTIDHCIVF